MRIFILLFLSFMYLFSKEITPSNDFSNFLKNDLVKKENTAIELFREYNKNTFITLDYGYSVSADNPKNFAKASLSIKPSNNLYANLEFMVYAALHDGPIVHKNNSIIGSNESYIVSMLSGLKFRPRYDISFNIYSGLGTTIGYSPVVSIGVINSGVDLAYMVSSWFSIHIGYKNIILMLSPTLDMNNFATAGIQITF